MTISKAVVVVEGPTEEKLVRAILMCARPGLPVHVGEAGGASPALPVAQSTLIKFRLPVALLMDADATDAMQIEARRQQIRSYMARVPVAQSDVFLASPHFESVFFKPVRARGRRAVEKLLGRELTRDEQERGMLHPVEVVRELLNLSVPELISRLDDDDLQNLAGVAPFPHLLAFIDEATAPAVESAA